jgi:hypothetical protein
LIVNLRAEADPAALKSALEGSLDETRRQCPHLELRLEHIEHFRPGKPQPTHRITAFAEEKVV